MSTPRKPWWRRNLVPAVIACVLLAPAYGIWQLASEKGSVRREAPRLMTIMPLPPPPPPPPKPPEPKVQEQVEEIETPVPEPDTPQPTDPPQAVTINSDAQAGGDAFGLAAGSGRGMLGSGATAGGFGSASYERHLSYELQRAIERDERVNRLVFRVLVDLWIDAGGRIERVEVARSSGDETKDRAVIAALQELQALPTAPPQAVNFPLRLTIRGQRPG
jgi:protein TonB